MGHDGMLYSSSYIKSMHLGKECAPMSHIDVKDVLEEEAVKKVYRYLPDGEVGPACTRLYKTITAIQKGEIEDIHGWCHEIK